MNWPLMTGDTEHLKQAAATVARANDWDVPKYLGEIFSWPLEQRNQAMSLAQKLKDEAVFQQMHGMSSRVFDAGIQMSQWDVR
jgi:hypothetical protein